MMGKKETYFKVERLSWILGMEEWNLAASAGLCLALFLKVLFAFCSPHALLGGGQFLPWSFGRKSSHTEKWGLPCWLRSSTRIISLREAFGAVSIMLCRVLSRVDQASSWKQMMTLALGRLESYSCRRHLHGIKRGRHWKHRYNWLLFSQSKVVSYT